MDFFADFNANSTTENFSASNRCPGWGRACYDSQNFAVDFYAVEGDRHTIGVLNGELLVRLADVGADVNGKVRITSKTPGQLSDDKFLHVTMDVDAYTTGRRYPQIIVSDRQIPVQDAFDQGSTIIIQTRGNWPASAEIQLCDHRIWDVNHQCPSFDLSAKPAALPGAPSGIRPYHMISDSVGQDRTFRFDAYVSSKRTYVYVNGSPYGCAIFPVGSVTPSGSVTTTWGHVLYHSGVDWWPHTGYIADGGATSEKIESLRHYSDLGFTSGTDLPPWDHQRLPCETTMQ